MGRTRVRPEFGRVENSKGEKPWGYELRWAITDRYAGKILHVKKGEALSLQFHERKDEFQYVIEGSVDIEIGGPDVPLTTRRMSAGATLHITPDTRHPTTPLQHTTLFN